MAITAIVIDSEPTFADALALRLDAEADITAMAAPPPTGPQPMGANPGWHADIILLDGDLFDSVRWCKAASGAALVIMLSHTSEAPRIVAAIEAGARAWVRKDESLEYLLCVVRGVARGETWLPPAATGSVLSLLLRQRDGRKDGHRRLALLTPRERQVLACLAEGAGRNQIAERLNLTANTVRTHLQNIMGKLGVHSTLEAVALTRAWSWPPEEP
jgi:DNA-binding NarL/FixJ family response regulator